MVVWGWHCWWRFIAWWATRFALGRINEDPGEKNLLWAICEKVWECKAYSNRHWVPSWSQKYTTHYWLAWKSIDLREWSEKAAADDTDVGLWALAPWYCSILPQPDQEIVAIPRVLFLRGPCSLVPSPQKL